MVDGAGSAPATRGLQPRVLLLSLTVQIGCCRLVSQPSSKHLARNAELTQQCEMARTAGIAPARVAFGVLTDTIPVVRIKEMVALTSACSPQASRDSGDLPGFV